MKEWAVPPGGYHYLGVIEKMLMKILKIVSLSI